eukprot:Filipodium_phascolosomae@DN8221_c0_g1_i1.p1
MLESIGFQQGEHELTVEAGPTEILNMMQRVHETLPGLRPTLATVTKLVTSDKQAEISLTTKVVIDAPSEQTQHSLIAKLSSAATSSGSGKEAGHNICAKPWEK